DGHEYDRDGARRVPQRHHYKGRVSQDHVRGERDHLGHLPAHFLRVGPAPANVDLGVAAHRPACFLQPLHERGETRLPSPVFRTEVHEHTDAAHALALLRARRERPSNRSATEKCDELAALQCRDHSITSSARSRKDSGSLRPSALATVRLTTSSNFVGCSTGSSPAFAPRRILSTYSPARRNKSGTFGPSLSSVNR